MIDVLALAEQDTNLHRASVNEQAGPCPSLDCRCKNDGFRVKWNGEKWAFMCRGCWDSQDMLADKGSKRGWGDAIDYLRHYRGMSFQQAKAFVNEEEDSEPSAPALVPGKANDDHTTERWQDATHEQMKRCIAALWSEEGASALGYARGRGLTDETIKLFRYGYDASGGIPRLIIPSVNDKRYVAVYRRDLRPDIAHDQRWKDAPGGTKSELYLADSLRIRKGLPVILVEDAFSASSIWQECNDLVNVVSTGGATCGKLVKWLVRLALAPLVLIALDADNPGDEESKWWLDRLANSKRLRPSAKDPNDMLQAGQSLRQWITSALPIPVEETPVIEQTIAATADKSPALSMEERIARFTSRPCGSCGSYEYTIDDDGRLICPCIIPKRQANARYHEEMRRQEAERKRVLLQFRPDYRRAS